MVMNLSLKELHNKFHQKTNKQTKQNKTNSLVKLANKVKTIFFSECLILKYGLYFILFDIVLIYKKKTKKQQQQQQQQQQIMK